MSRKMTTSAVVLLLALAALCGTIHSAAEENVTPRKEFAEASITIFPVVFSITGPVEEQHREFADAITRKYREDGREFAGTLMRLLEEKGCDKLEVTDTDFRFPEGKTAGKERATAFGEFVRELDLKTDYALCTETTLQFNGGGWQEVYSVIVDAKGRIVWEDSQGPGDSDFDSDPPLGPPESCLELVCRRLIPAMGLDMLTKRELSEETKQALQEMRRGQPPSQSEFAAIKKRAETMKKAGGSARLMLYPTRVGGDHTEHSRASNLAELINGAELCKATVTETGPVLEGYGWPNEMKVLWIFARAAREYARQYPTDSDYVLFADYWLNPSGQVWAVHFVVCDRAGDWVIVDFQNNHHEDFQRIDPKTLADCDRLVLERLKSHLS